MTGNGSAKVVRPVQPAVPPADPAPRTPPPLRAAAVVAVLLGLIAAGAVWVGHLAPPGTTDGGLWLEVWDHDTNRAVHTRPVAVGETFQVRHTHSVTRRPVIETFSVAGRQGIAIEELWFDEFGPNLPAGPEQIGETTTTFIHEDGGFRVLHHGRLLPTVPIRVGSPGVNHVVSFSDGTPLRLLDVAAQAAFVEVRIVTDANRASAASGGSGGVGRPGGFPGGRAGT